MHWKTKNRKKQKIDLNKSPRTVSNKKKNKYMEREMWTEWPKFRNFCIDVMYMVGFKKQAPAKMIRKIWWWEENSCNRSSQIKTNSSTTDCATKNIHFHLKNIQVCNRLKRDRHHKKGMIHTQHHITSYHITYCVCARTFFHTQTSTKFFWMDQILHGAWIYHFIIACNNIKKISIHQQEISHDFRNHIEREWEKKNKEKNKIWSKWI